MSDIHALSGAYAVDALDEIERARFERHLAGCAECQGEVASLREAAAALAEDTAVAPPEDLRARVLAGIATVRPLPPTAPAPLRAGRLRRWAPALVAALVLAVAGVGTAVWRPWQDDTSVTVSATDRVLQAPDAAEETLTFPGGASATLVRSDSEGRAVLVTQAMPAAPPGKVYQLWLDVPGRGMVPAGLMPPKADQAVLLDGDATAATGAGITVEPAGGSAEPTTDPIALFSFDDLEPGA